MKEKVGFLITEAEIKTHNDWFVITEDGIKAVDLLAKKYPDKKFKLNLRPIKIVE